MAQSAQTHKPHVLISEAATFLGQSLAQSLLAQNCTVYGTATTALPHHVITNHDFTLLEYDLSQPLPTHLPKFDIILDFTHLKTHSHNAFLAIPPVSTQTASLITLAKTQPLTKIFIFAPINTPGEFYEYLTGGDENLKDRLKLFLVGDLYGPHMKSDLDNQLAKLIFQAINTDKLILENDGLTPIYPAYISDVTFAVNKFVFSQGSFNNIQQLVSENAKTTLSIAYEIQNAIRLAAAKEISLFFASRTTDLTPSHYPVDIKIHSLGFSPKVQLEHGLKNTFEYFASQNLIKLTTRFDFTPSTTAHNQQTRTILSKQEPISQNRKRLTLKIPKVAASFGFKKIIALATLIIGLFMAKLTLDLYLGAKNINSTKKLIQTSDFQAAAKNAKSAHNHFASAATLVKIITYPISLFAYWQIEPFLSTFQAASEASMAISYFATGAEILTHDLLIITSPQTENKGFDLESPAADFKRAYVGSAVALKLLENSPNFAPLSKATGSAQKELLELNNIAKTAYELVNLVDDFTGTNSPKSYLLLLQNNTELRPGGGFIGNVGLVEFEAGKLKNISVEDVYTIDGQLREKIEPPQALKVKLGASQLYLRDSNWSIDFQINAKTAKDFFRKETGKNVDGVIAMDLIYVQNLLSKIGPIKLSDYNEQITDANIFERGEYYSEIGFFPGSTQKRDFFGALTRTLINTIIENFNSSDKNNSTSSLLAIVGQTSQGLAQKHIQLSFDNQNLASFVQTNSWDNPLPPTFFNVADDLGQTRDFLAISEANLGANKVNRFIDRKIFYEMTIGRDADLVGTLKIIYKNNSQAETWPAGKYTNFLRVYVPFAASLLDYQQSIPSAKPPEDKTKKAKNLKTPDLVSPVEITTLGNLTVFAAFVEVPINSTQEVTFKYRIPKNIKLETAPTYHLYVQKQPGTDKDPLELKLNLPGYLVVKSVNGKEESARPQNIGITSDLSTDRQFEVEIAKK